MSGRGARSSVASAIIPPWRHRGALGFWLRVAVIGVVLAETGGLKVVISLDYLPQPVLRAAVAAIGVGMEALHQCLIARLDFRRILVALEIECGKGASFEVLQRPLGRLGPRPVGPPAPAANAERGPAGLGPGMALADALGRLGGGTVVDADGPGRAMAGRGGALIGGNIVVGHAGEVV